MALVIAAADDEEVGDYIIGSKVEQEDILRLAILHEVYNLMSQF